jgi:spermidine/putrescine ABC transporter ATP-binding subunit
VQPMIRIQRVTKRFGMVPALSEASFDIQAGEFFSILGASGSGKTTLLRILAGFEAATSGSVQIDGAPMDAVPPHQRPVNMVFQNYAIFPHLNVRDNIGFGLRKLRLDRAERARRIDAMLDLIKLPGFGHRRPDQLSGGQRQRVALARALILRPKVLLLDEPLGALDKQLREQMQRELRALQRSLDITFVLVTHDQEEAMALSDRIAVMAEGRVLQIDTPAGLYEAPATRSVAGFVGSMNFLTGHVVGRQNGHASIALPGGSICKLPAARVSGRERDICLAIRPERITLHPIRPEGPSVPGRLRDKVYLGERVHYHVGLGEDGPTLAVSVPNTASLEAAPGTDLWLSWPPEAMIALQDE